MRSIALDVHRDFCEVAIKDESGLRLAGRVRSSVSELELFAQSLAPDDEVALEATGGALAIARILEGHVARAVLARNLKGRPPVTDVFGKRGREWLAAIELPADERETVDCCLREVDFLDNEVGLIERELARQAMSCQEIRRLMTVPGVSLVS